MSKQRQSPGLDAQFNRASAAWDAGDIELAFTLFLDAAQRGDTSSKLSLGYFYDCGIGRPKNVSRALSWYRSAYKDGCSAAVANIATIHRDAKAYRKQTWWLRRAAHVNDGDAMLDLGRCYLRGQSVNRNRPKAVALFRQGPGVAPSGRLSLKPATFPNHAEAGFFQSLLQTKRLFLF